MTLSRRAPVRKISRRPCALSFQGAHRRRPPTNFETTKIVDCCRGTNFSEVCHSVSTSRELRVPRARTTRSRMAGFFRIFWKAPGMGGSQMAGAQQGQGRVGLCVAQIGLEFCGIRLRHRLVHEHQFRVGRTETPSVMIPRRCVSVFCFFLTSWSGKAPVFDSLFFFGVMTTALMSEGHGSPDICSMIFPEFVIVIVFFQSSNLCSVLTQPAGTISKPCVSNHEASCLFQRLVRNFSFKPSLRKLKFESASSLSFFFYFVCLVFFFLKKKKSFVTF